MAGKLLNVLVGLLLITTSTTARSEEEIEDVQSDELPILRPGNFNFSYWDFVVSSCVYSGVLDGIELNLFDYVKLATNKIVNDHYVAFGKQLSNAELTGLNQSEFMAFWLNTYNYLAVKTILENPCQKDMFGDCCALTTIKQVGQQQPSIIDTVWDMPQLQISTPTNLISLNDIEIGYLRNHTANPSKKQDVRLHCSIVSSAISSPNLRNRSYTVENIEEELTESAKEFLANTMKGAILNGGGISISKIFLWSSSDFNNSTSNAASVISFIQQYGPSDIQDYINMHLNTPLDYLDYNWYVNGNVAQLCKVNRPCFPWWALLCLLLGLLILAIVVAVCVRRRMHGPYQSLPTLN